MVKKKEMKVEVVEKVVKKGEKKNHILERAKEFITQKGEFTIGEFMKYLKEKDGEQYYRPYVYNVLKKNCDVEYRDVGKRKVIFVKGINA